MNGSDYQIFLAQSNNVISPENPIWYEPLPSTAEVLTKGGRAIRKGLISYGDYFTAIQSFIEHDGHRAIFRAFSGGIGGKDPNTNIQIQAVRVHLVKHGHFYHPSQVIVHTPEKVGKFVLNVAVSEHGKKIIRQEFLALERLNRDFGYDYLPQVFTFGEGTTEDGQNLPMFLGEWLDGYREFHISNTSGEESNSVIVWDDDSNAFYLTTDQIKEMIRHASRILTAYYNPLTFEHIYPWHHGAGDFVVRIDEGKTSVKMITSRNYQPMFQADSSIAPDLGTVLNGFLVFFLNLSIRMRIDRLDGVGKVVLYEKSVIPSIVKGFFEGCQQLSDHHRMPAELSSIFRRYLKGIKVEEMLELTEDLLLTYPEKGDEREVFSLQMKEHVSFLHNEFMI